MNNKIETHCPNCGAPVTTEICPYCNAMTGLDTKNANMEYPVIECKEAATTFINTTFPLIFAIGFGFFGFVFPIIFITSSDTNPFFIISLCSIFAIIGIVSFAIFMISILRNSSIKRNGKEIEATVYGYMDDNFTINDQAAQIVKLLIQTDNGPKFILYQLGDTKRPYKINSKIRVIVYKNLFLIPKNKNIYY